MRLQQLAGDIPAGGAQTFGCRRLGQVRCGYVNGSRGLLDIQRNVEPDRARAATDCLGIGLGQHHLQVFFRTHQLRVLADRTGHRDGRAFLIAQLPQPRHIME
ncbi:hypothetical protein D3C80_869800 [compost metagenome]